MKKVLNEDKTEYLSLKEKLHETLLLHFELELYFLFIAFLVDTKLAMNSTERSTVHIRNMTNVNVAI